MTSRRRRKPSPPREHEEGRPFQFSEDDVRTLLAHMSRNANAEAKSLFLARLTRLAGLYRSVKYEDELQPLEGEIRARLKELQSAFGDLHSTIRHKIVRRADEGATQVWEVVNDPLLDEVRNRLATSLHPVLTSWLQDRLRDDRWLRRMPSEVRHLACLEGALKEIAVTLEAATVSHSKGGRPQAKSKRALVQGIVREYWATFGKLPPTTKNSPFEEQVRVCLDAVGYSSGDANEAIRQAIPIIKSETNL